MWITNIEMKESKKIPKDNNIPDGWVKGYRLWNEIKRQEEKDKKRNESKLKKIEKDNLMKTATIIMFKKYINSDYLSLNSFAKENFDKSLVTLTKRFIKYIEGYKEVSKQGGQNLKKDLSKLIV